MGIPADVMGDIIGDSTHPSPSDSVHLILAHDIARRRFFSQDEGATSSPQIPLSSSNYSTLNYPSLPPYSKKESSLSR
jgi:hypothetical protein